MSSTAFADLLLAHLFTGAASPVGANVYVGLSTAVPTDDDGTGWAEAAYSGYARVSVSTGGTGFTSSGGGVIVNAAAWAWPIPAVDVTVAAWGLWTAATGGTLIDWGRLAAATTIPHGSAPTLDAGIAPVRGLG